MRYKQKNKKGVALILALFFAVMLAGLAGITYIRSVNEANLTQRFLDSSQAFYEAEAGLAYAYSEASSSGFEWYTHKDKDTKVTVTETLSVNNGAMKIEFRSPVPHVVPNSSIHGTTGCYQVSGRGFSVKAFPDQKSDGTYTGAITVLSQATVNGASKTVELRIGQKSAYQYFFFFPGDHEFGTATIDGRNFGGIHVNGTVFFKGNPSFKYLTALTSGSEVEGKGYIVRKFLDKYKDLHGELNYTNYSNDPHTLSDYMYLNAQSHWSTGTVKFRTGAYNPDEASDAAVTAQDLPYYLTGVSAAWNYQKYPTSADTTPAHYTISDQNLKNTAVYEITHPEAGGTDLLDAGKTITFSLGPVPILEGTEPEVFKKLIENDELVTQVGGWTAFWNKWKNNHKDDYSVFHTSGTFTENLPGNNTRDWERKFFVATYNFGGLDDGIPDGVNREWWTDLSYGDDNASGAENAGKHMAPAKVEQTADGLGLTWYFLNTKEQGDAWNDWLQTHQLDTDGAEKTLIKDRSQGGQAVDVGDIVSSASDNDKLAKKALDSGIYVGNAVTPEYQVWEGCQIQIANSTNCDALLWPAIEVCDACDWSCEECDTAVQAYDTCWTAYMTGVNEQCGEQPTYSEFHNPIPEALQITSFYNVATPGWVWNSAINKIQYAPTSVLVVDVYKLKELIDEAKSLPQAQRTPEQIQLANFNGILYINDATINQSVYAQDIMLVNGERLPDGGLSIVVPNNNVLIKGDYNLDPAGDATKNRQADDQQIIQRVTTTAHYERNAGTSYMLGVNDLSWQPAEIITRNSISTLSSVFPEPQYMPMNRYYPYQFNEEDEYVASQDYVSGDKYYPTNSWVPNAVTNVTTKMQQWFSYYKDASNNSPSLPAGGKWTKEWVDANWPGDKVFALDTDGNGTKDTYILGQELRDAASGAIGTKYQADFSFSQVHGVDGTQNPNAPSLVNVVTQPHVYNTALVTPYDTSPTVLENWGTTQRIMNGAFIQLPQNYKGYQVRSSARYNDYRIGKPQETVRYETRFGKGSATTDRPRSNLTFGAEGSWREVREGSF